MIIKESIIIFMISTYDRGFMVNIIANIYSNHKYGLQIAIIISIWLRCTIIFICHRPGHYFSISERPSVNFSVQQLVSC